MKEFLVGIGVGAMTVIMLYLFLKSRKKDTIIPNRLPVLTPHTDKAIENIEKEKETLAKSTPEEKATHVESRLDRFRRKKT